MKMNSTLKIVSFFLLFFCSARLSFSQDVIVAKDGSGNFTTVQAAIDAAPTARTTPYVILVKNGRYREKVTVPSNKPFLQLVGESVVNTIVYYDDPATVLGTQNSASFTISADDFSAMNITFQNSYGDGSQAVAVLVNADRAAFKNCRFLGNQDTLYVKGNGTPRHYYRNCYIDGNTDFIFGSSVDVFDSCVIYAKSKTGVGTSYITAANTLTGQAYGLVFRNCKVGGNAGTTNYDLGRPWQSNPRVVYLNSYLYSGILGEGWSTTSSAGSATFADSYFAEYKSRNMDGTLVDTTKRAKGSRQLSDAEAANYTLTNMFGTWDPCAVINCTSSTPALAVSNFRGTKGNPTSTFNWNISFPVAQLKFEIFRSTAKTTGFAKIGEVIAPNDTTYNFQTTDNIPPSGSIYYYYIQSSKAGYVTAVASDTVVISSAPTINVSGSVGTFTQNLGTPSPTQTYTVSATDLTDNLVITPSTYWEISPDGTTWYYRVSPLSLTPTNGTIANTTIYVRLNSIANGPYSGALVHTSTGAATVNVTVNGTTVTPPSYTITTLQQWPLDITNADSAAVRSSAVTASTPTFKNLTVSNGTTVPGLTAYSPTFGQAFGASSNGDGTWTTAVGGPGGNVNRTIYEQFTVTNQSSFPIRVDSIVLTSAFYATASSTKLAAVYSNSGFTSDSTDVSGGTGPTGTLAPATNGAFATPIVLLQQNTGPTNTYALALAGANGDTLAAGKTVTIRLYFSCSSSSPGRYAMLKNVLVKGVATANPITGDYQTHQTGDWTDLNTWERYDGTQWINPAPTYPVYNNSNTTTILNGHTITVSATLSNGSGYIRRTKINNGGQVIVNSGANLNIANDGTPSTATTDLQVDGSFTLFGGLFTNGNISVVINGSFVNSGTGMNLNNAGDTTVVGNAGIYQHNVNSASLIPGNTTNALIWQPGSTFLITGLTTNQTGIFRNAVKYSNIIWNNTNETAYYSIRNTLDSTNVKGTFTIQSTGSTYITFANSNGRTVFQGGYYQTGGIVNYRESGNITDTLASGGDFSVTGGTFNSNAGAGSSLLVSLSGVNKLISYNQSGATNTNWDVSGNYALGSNINLVSSAYALNVSGSLDMGTNTISGAGDMTLRYPAVLSSASAGGLNGNIAITGIKTLSTAATYVFNGTVAQVTGAMLPATVYALTINNAADVTLSGSAVVTNGLTLSAGHLILQNNNLTASSVLGSSSAKYVITNGTGALKIKNIGFISAGSDIFPVGSSSTAYNPVTFYNAGAVDNFSVNVKNTFDNPVPNPNAVVNKQWTINEDIAGGSNGTVSLSWTTSDQAAGFNPANTTSIIHFNGTIWEAKSATITGSGTLASPYVATASGFTSFSPFAVANDVALPLNLISFNAALTANGVIVTWNTANEVNTQFYEVERSTDGRTFSSIATVAAKNTSAADYSAVDASPADGVAYYRLKMTDKDGTVKYSRIAVVNSSLKGTVTLYPNPVTSSVTVTHAKAAGNAFAEVIALDGRKLITQKLSLNTTQSSLDVSGLTGGMYVLSITNGIEKANLKFVKK